jgi:hypothetical protein
MAPQPGQTWRGRLSPAGTSTRTGVPQFEQKFMFDADWNLGEVCSIDKVKKTMAHDNWLNDLNEQLRRSRNPLEVREIIERIEDQYDSFEGPGQELVDQVLAAARTRLAGMLAELAR